MLGSECTCFVFAHGSSPACPGRLRASVKRVIIASHRGYSAGVERAVETVERALEIYGAPIYVSRSSTTRTWSATSRREA
jgi:hypothetical protein